MSSREHLLEVATRLFARRGYSGTGLRKLAEEAGAALSMVNYHFGSKQGLLEAIFDDFHARYAAALRPALESGDTLEEKVEAWVGALVSVARTNPHQVRVCFTELPDEVPSLAAYKAERIRDVRDLLQTHITPLLPRPQEQRVHFIGPAVTSATLSHFLVRPVLEHVVGDLPDTDEFYALYARQIAGLLLNGLAA